MNTPLLTRDGFPRADIDVAQSTYMGLLRSERMKLTTLQSALQEPVSFTSEMITRVS